MGIHSLLIYYERRVDRNAHLKGVLLSSSANVASKQSIKNGNSHQSNHSGRNKVTLVVVLVDIIVDITSAATKIDSNLVQIRIKFNVSFVVFRHIALECHLCFDICCGGCCTNFIFLCFLSNFCTQYSDSRTTNHITICLYTLVIMIQRKHQLGMLKVYIKFILDLILMVLFLFENTLLHVPNFFLKKINFIYFPILIN